MSQLKEALEKMVAVQELIKYSKHLLTQYTLIHFNTVNCLLLIKTQQYRDAWTMLK
jgi:hypothetical protein